MPAFKQKNLDLANLLSLINIPYLDIPIDRNYLVLANRLPYVRSSTVKEPHFLSGLHDQVTRDLFVVYGNCRNSF